MNDPATKWRATKWLLLLPVPLALAACEVGQIKMPMAPMTLGPSETTHAACAGADEATANAACRTQAPAQKRQ